MVSPPSSAEATNPPVDSGSSPLPHHLILHPQLHLHHPHLSPSTSPTTINQQSICSSLKSTNNWPTINLNRHISDCNRNASLLNQLNHNKSDPFYRPYVS